MSRLNGVPMIDFTDPKPKSFDGPIALQLHSGGEGDMMFKEIYIRDLSNRTVKLYYSDHFEIPLPPGHRFPVRNTGCCAKFFSRQACLTSRPLL